MAAAKSPSSREPGDRSDAKTRPISFRVSEAALDALVAAGKSPAEIGRAAIEREARIAKRIALIECLKKHPIKFHADEDSVTIIRRLRDSS